MSALPTVLACIGSGLAIGTLVLALAHAADVVGNLLWPPASVTLGRAQS